MRRNAVTPVRHCAATPLRQIAVTVNLQDKYRLVVHRIIQVAFHVKQADMKALEPILFLQKRDVAILALFQSAPASTVEQYSGTPIRHHVIGQERL